MKFQFCLFLLLCYASKSFCGLRLDKILSPFAVLAVGALMSVVQPAQAICLSTSGENNCSSFSGDTLSQVTQTYTSANLASNKFFQMGFRSSDGAAYTINNIAYAKSGDPFAPIFSSVSVLTGSDFQYITIQNPFGGGALESPFYVRYDISPIVPSGVTIDSEFLANNTGSATGGVLNDHGGNYEAVVRSHTAVPAPLPLLGTAAVFSSIKRLQRASQKLRRT
jgi:hypothetical protein